MQRLMIGITVLALLCGCAQNRLQSDFATNAFVEKQVYADAGANYVGEWTASTKIGIRSIKIRGDGLAKVCLAGSGTTDGKVYLENAVPALIVKSGAKVAIIEANKDFLLLNIYGNEEKYYAGQVHETCQSAFANFK